MRLGIFGGMFDPPHIGHLILAERTVDMLGLDKMLMVPSGNHPTKPTLTPAEDRLALCQLTFANNPRFEVSDIESKKQVTSYTLDTVTELAAQYPGSELYLCIGADNAASFHQWYKPEEILDRCKIVVWARKPITINSPFAEYMQVLSTPLLDVSSTEIRTILKHHHSIRYMVTDAVAEYITNHGLYR